MMARPYDFEEVPVPVDGPRGPILGMRLRNLRNFADTGEIALKSMNFVFGKNSSGKTTLLRAPLLFKQFVETTQHLHGTIDNVLAGPYVDFGSFADAVHNSQVSKDITLEFTLDLGENLRRYVPARRTSDHIDKIHRINVAVVLHWNKTRGHLQFSTIVARDIAGDIVFKFDRLGPQRVKAQMPPVGLNRTYSDVGELSFDTVRRVSLASFDTKDLSILAYFYLVEVLNESLSLVQHVGPLRDMPERAYRTDQLAIPGDPTRNSLGLLFNNKRALSMVTTALRSLGMARDLELTTPAPGYSGISIANMATSRRDNLADVGFGVSQVLPILATVATAPAGSLILIEQPELHLHPETQGSLVDALTTLAFERKVSLLIETHSENMLLRLRRKVARRELAVDDVQVLVTADNEVREAKVAGDGSIDIGAFPNDFFEEDWLDTVEIARASRAR